jgi:hypothetical protein
MYTGYDADSLGGVALSADIDFALAMCSGMPLMGDAYPEEEICRGFAMGATDFMSISKFGPQGFAHDGDQAQFFLGDVPPAMPIEPGFCLEGTTVIVENSSPENIGNGLLNLLRQQAAAFITKVNRTKFTVKAYVHVDGCSCDVKIRVYRQDLRFAVEFQRQSGDAVAFGGLFRRALEHLNSYSRAAASPEKRVFIDAHRPTVMQAPVVGQAGSSKQELSIAPLLEMAGSSSDLRLQAEVAEALANYAVDASLSSQLNTPHALKVRQDLAMIDHISVIHPMRRLEAALSHVTPSNVSFFEGADSCIFETVGVAEPSAPPQPPRMRL